MLNSTEQLDAVEKPVSETVSSTGWPASALGGCDGTAIFFRLGPSGVSLIAGGSTTVAEPALFRVLKGHLINQKQARNTKNPLFTSRNTH
nr:hypothetical protein [uncultured Devosia sp.]